MEKPPYQIVLRFGGGWLDRLTEQEHRRVVEALADVLRAAATQQEARREKDNEDR